MKRETEMGGTKIYETALRCVQDEELKEEWGESLEQTKTHVEVMRGVFDTFGLDPEAESRGRLVVRYHITGWCRELRIRSALRGRSRPGRTGCGRDGGR